MSTLRVNTVADATGSGPCDFTGQVAVKAAARHVSTALSSFTFNAASFTDNGAGNYDIGLTNSFVSSAHMACSSTSESNTVARCNTYFPSASSLGHRSFNSSGTPADSFGSVSTMGTLA